MSLPNTSRELKKLSEKNLIEKINDSEDRRKQFILLTNEREALMGEAFAKIEARFQERIQHASKEDLEEIERPLIFLMRNCFINKSDKK